MAKRNAVLNPSASIKEPKIKGMIAPPTIAMHNNPDACALRSPKPSKLSVKIVGNIIELNNPTAKIDHIEIKPVVAIDIRIIPTANDAKMLRTLAGAKIVVK